MISSTKFILILIALFCPLICSSKTIAPYGTWKSPITEAMITKDALSFESIKIDPKYPDSVIGQF